MAKYSYQGSWENTAKVLSTYLPISRKHSHEVANFIRGKLVSRAIAELGLVAEGKLAVPYKRYVLDIPHRKGMCTGRFPRNASLQFLKLLNSLVKNAESIGLDTSNLQIVHVAAQHTGATWHYGRFRGRKRKMCHIELVAKEGEKAVGEDEKHKSDRKQEAAAKSTKDKLEKKAKSSAKKNSKSDKPAEKKGGDKE